MYPAIVVATYNRPKSLNRLLGSINDASYPDSSIELIISIDFQDSDAHSKVVEIANNFVWQHGQKRIIIYNENLGLREHILSCGNLTEEYDAVIVLEDDLFVSPAFYDYSVQMLKAYSDEDAIAGISLYTHEWNVLCDRPFVPACTEYDVFCLQFAQSWGQCWSGNMWQQFMKWYRREELSIHFESFLPEAIRLWPKSSWLKYYMGYIVDTNKYFIYPYFSLSTNFSEAGTHNSNLNADFQVSLNLNKQIYRVPSLNNALKYDIYFERIGLGEYCNIAEKDLCVDLYGIKENINTPFLLSSKNLDYKILNTYGCQLRPQETNIICNIHGNDFQLYDCQVLVNGNTKRRDFRLLYDYKRIHRKRLWGLLKTVLMNKIVLFSNK